MWEVRKTVGTPDNYTRGNYVQLQILKDRIKEMQQQLDDLSTIWEN